MKVVYIAHPISGHVENNLKEIKRIAREISLMEVDVIPFAPYYLTCVSLDDSNVKERELGMKYNKFFLEEGIVDELRLYGDRISDGMWKEIEIANEFSIDIKCMNTEIKADYKRNISDRVMSFSNAEVHLITNALRFTYGKKMDGLYGVRTNDSESERKAIVKQANKYDDLASKIEEL